MLFINLGTWFGQPNWYTDNKNPLAGPLHSTNTSSAKLFLTLDQGFFQVLCHTTVFVFQIEIVKALRPFLMSKRGRNQKWVCRALSPPAGPGKSPSNRPRGKAPGSSGYLGFGNILLFT